MLSLIPDNEDLLKFSASLRIELEYLIYTIEQHRSATGRRYIKARERFAAGLVRFLNDAVLSQPHTDDSAIASSEPVPIASNSVDVENLDPAPTEDVLSAVCESEIRSDTHSTEDDGVKLAVESEPSINHNDSIPTKLESTRHGADNDQHLASPPSVQMKETLVDKVEHQETPTESKSQTIPPVISYHTEMPLEENRCLWMPDIPAQVTLSQVYDQLCGGAIDRIESFPHKKSDGYGVSVTFLEHSAAERYLDYVNTPEGRIVFQGVPSSWKYDVLWNPRPQLVHYRVMSMARNPFVRARRCLIIKNFPVELTDAGTLALKLRKFGGNFSTWPRVQKVFIDKKSKEATIHMERVSCALQLVESKICGKWGEEFDNCTFVFGKDECERPIPGMGEGTSEGVQYETVHSSITKGQTEAYIQDHMDPRYEFYHSRKYFPKMRSLCVSMLPSTTTISDMVAQIRGGALERITLDRKLCGMITASITFVHHSSAQAWYEYVITPHGRIRFPNLVWDWYVRWEENIEPVGRDIWHDFINPAIKARRGFVLKNLSSHQEISVETLKEDVLSQSSKRISFEKFELNWKKREARVTMTSIGSAIGGITMIRRLGRYKGCRIEFLKDECEDPIPLSNTVEEQQNVANLTKTSCIVNDIDVITHGIVQPPIYAQTLLIKHLPVSTTHRQLSSRIRGGALDNLQIRDCCELNDCLVSFTFLDNHAAEKYFTYITETSAVRMDISWGPDVARKPASALRKDITRVLIIKGFPSVFKESSITLAIEKIVKHSAWILKINQRNMIESITVKGEDRKIARVILTSVRLAAAVKTGLPRYWSGEFGRDECEGPVTELEISLGKGSDGRTVTDAVE